MADRGYKVYNSKTSFIRRISVFVDYLYSIKLVKIAFGEKFRGDLELLFRAKV